MSDQDDPRSESAGDRQPREGDERRRYFTESMGFGQSGNRHRRRRAPGDPTTTGSIPIVRTGDSLPDPTIEYRTPERPAGEPSPYFQVQYRPSEVEGLSFTEPRTSPYASEPPTVVNPPVRHQQPPAQQPPAAASEPTGLFDILDATQEESARPAPAAATPAPAAPAPIPSPEPSPAPVAAGITDPNLGAPVPTPARVESAAEPAHAAPARVTAAPDYLDDETDDDVDRPMPARKRNRKVLLTLLILAVVVVLVLSGIALKALGVFDSSKDYDSTTGHGAALVHVASDSSIRDIGDTLADAGVVGSRKAFVDATGTETVAAGFYKLPKGISAATAVQKMQGPENRVGSISLPEGRQLDSKKGADGKTTPGVFEMIATATSVKTDDGTYGVTVKQLTEAASDASADELGIPAWARETFDKLGGDHRRIEGLIAAGSWENIDPREDATQILRSLITASADRFTAWGIESDTNTGLTPYQTLVTASIVEREAFDAADFPKVARVILNRLKVDQRLEMDSTANYTADIQNIDLGGAAYKDENAWNTYQHKGLPITPIGTVGERALNATIDPANGDWLYFVTVDKDGKTLFSKTFEQHKKNRQVACKNKLLVTGC
ncbi:endolytic transglycosylase MltG [Gordonia phthalatica]|uniref:Endolytic murein transglycosylase n=1 Tax=Gordonia phthalatica TaxID=1136941 RepID=A0A0N9NH39_9ACTN|nr:endolytic transglycosylase MltG [Gordonia phthalatica]ALG84731.1 aminodeoxychorismate lyase [Gordonia phthalatica]